jgi:uncharacterized protein
VGVCRLTFKSTLQFQLDKLILQGHYLLMRERTIADAILRSTNTFPAVVLTGPRQSGKTTLLKSEFGKTHSYLSLENPDVRIRAKTDPIGFLSQITGPVILDEIQYVPELLPYIKTAIDENRKPGNWLLTGSQNFLLMHGVSESLAGRAAVLTLLPFSISERVGLGKSSLTVDDLLKTVDKKSPTDFDIVETILRGNYPEISSNSKVDRQLWCNSYINTYLERDIRNIQQVGDLRQYEIFLRACAAHNGQILDLSSIARDIGVTFTTAKRWLSLLETGYQVLLLYPYYKNIGKRLVKRPKLYFMDTGLASYLLGIHNKETLIASSYYGSLFESMVVTDFWKRFVHHGQTPTMYYLRTRDGLEIDLVIESENKLYLIEIKSSSTIGSRHAASLLRMKKDLGSEVGKTYIISNSPEPFVLHGNIHNAPAKYMLPR